MRSLFRLVTLLFFVFLCVSAIAQKKDSTYVGTADGVVRDSVYNFVIQSSSVAIYKVKDSSLVNYRLADNFGEFHFKDLPVNMPLKIVVSFVGYKTLTRSFTIPAITKQINLKNLNLDRSDETNLKEVVVNATPPPVRMNGDTLEFNADAFKLDKNAVAEDLLRRLPGITVWGDGTITFNGKQVSQVLVEGKPFFGGDAKIATQNIAKDAIDKIQVYQQNADRKNPLDSITKVNIKLKKNKRFGSFGKLAAGYGTNKRYETDANINYFNSRTQIGLVGASNNVNKMARDANILMRNSTFKGTGANVEYQSDFSTQGINQSNSGGFIFQHDFIPDPDFNKNNRLTADYFLNNNTNTINQNSQTTTRLNGDSTQVQQNSSTSKSNNTSQNFNARYDKQKNEYSYYFAAKANLNSSHSQSNNLGTSSTTQGLQSKNNANTDSNNNTKNISFETGYTTRQFMPHADNPLNDFSINYSVNTGTNHSDKNTTTRFLSFANPSENKLFDRNYNSNNDNTAQHLYMSLGNLANSFYVKRGILSHVDVEVQNNLDINLHHENNNVQDRDTLTNNYKANLYLTNVMKTVVVNERPALVITKNLENFFANRYLRTLNIRFNVEGQFFNLDNNSTQSFQNFKKNYQRFIPGASISYKNNQFGDFEDSYTLNFATTVSYPTPQQLYPLIDSANQYYIQQGNPNLKPATNRIVSFNFKHINQHSKNTFNYDLGINAGFINNFFADSSIIDKSGRSTHYIVNIAESENLGISANLNKAFKFANNHQFQINLNTNLNLSKTPGYVNTVFITSNSVFSQNMLNLYYTYLDKVAIDLKQGYSYYHSKQNGNSNNEFNNSVLPTAFSISVNCTRKLTINSNITYNHTTSTGSAPINFTIWNASANYRFMRGNNLELKVSALDLLHQNTNIINYGNNNSITRGITNVLQQYGMVTLSYFPRKFGKAKKG